MRSSICSTARNRTASRCWSRARRAPRPCRPPASLARAPIRTPAWSRSRRRKRPAVIGLTSERAHHAPVLLWTTRSTGTGMHVSECDVPPSSALGRDLIRSAYFHDSYRVPLARRGLTIVKIFFALFGHTPRWMKALLITPQYHCQMLWTGSADRRRNSSACGAYELQRWRQDRSMADFLHWRQRDRRGPQ